MSLRQAILGRRPESLHSPGLEEFEHDNHQVLCSSATNSSSRL